MPRLNNEKDPRTKRAFAHAAIVEAKRTDSPLLRYRAYAKTLDVAHTPKGAGLPGNALGALGVQAVFQEGLAGLDPDHLSSRLLMTSRENIGYFERAAFHIPGLDMRRWPLGSIEDYRRFVAAKRGNDEKLSQDLGVWDELSTEALAALHFRQASVPVEIVWDRGNDPTAVTGEFWEEYHRLSMEGGEA